jgi:hypothetical protein
LHFPVNGDAAEEFQVVRLVADGVYVGAAVLHTDEDAGGAGAGTGLPGPRLVFVVAVEQIRVAWSMGYVYRHTLEPRLLQVEDVRALLHLGARARFVRLS